MGSVWSEDFRFCTHPEVTTLNAIRKERDLGTRMSLERQLGNNSFRSKRKQKKQKRTRSCNRKSWLSFKKNVRCRGEWAGTLTARVRLRQQSAVNVTIYQGLRMLSPKNGNSVWFIPVLAAQLLPHCLGYHYLIIQLNKYYVRTLETVCTREYTIGRYVTILSSFSKRPPVPRLVWLSFLFQPFVNDALNFYIAVRKCLLLEKNLAKVCTKHFLSE